MTTATNTSGRADWVALALGISERSLYRKLRALAGSGRRTPTRGQP